MIENYKINAVLEDDLLKLLQLFNKVEELKLGQCKCFVCGRTLELSTIGSLHIVNGVVKLKCNEIECDKLEKNAEC
jgi:hypothetical protein